MKTKNIPLLFFFVLFAGSFVCSQEKAESVIVTYIANEGFLIETGSHKILVDALFGNIKGNWCDQPGDSVTHLMLKGIPPFDNVDLVLVTHKHSDHFNASMVIDFLTNSRKSILICPGQVNEILQRNAGYSMVSQRIHPFESRRSYDTSVSIYKTDVRILRINHGSWLETDSVTGTKYDIHRDVENFGYIIGVDGFSLFHSGDGSASAKQQFEMYRVGTKEFDIAFVDRTFLRKEGQELLNEYIHSRNIIFMHVEPGKAAYYQSVIKSIPEMFVFTHPMEKREFQKPQ